MTEAKSSSASSSGAGAAASAGNIVVPAAAPSHLKTYILVGVVAAAVSAATAGYVVWSRSHRLVPQAETVQDLEELLVQCHRKVDEIARLVEKMRPHASQASESSAASATVEASTKASAIGAP